MSVIWLMSLVCVEPVASDCGFSDRILSPLTASRSLEECEQQARAFHAKMKLSGKWAAVCTRAEEIVK